jgi:hypothetical protein
MKKMTKNPFMPLATSGLMRPNPFLSKRRKKRNPGVFWVLGKVLNGRFTGPAIGSFVGAATIPVMAKYYPLGSALVGTAIGLFGGTSGAAFAGCALSELFTSLGSPYLFSSSGDRDAITAAALVAGMPGKVA